MNPFQAMTYIDESDIDWDNIEHTTLEGITFAIVPIKRDDVFPWAFASDLNICDCAMWAMEAWITPLTTINTDILVPLAKHLKHYDYIIGDGSDISNLYIYSFGGCIVEKSDRKLRVYMCPEMMMEMMRAALFPGLVFEQWSKEEFLENFSHFNGFKTLTWRCVDMQGLVNEYNAVKSS